MTTAPAPRPAAAERPAPSSMLPAWGLLCFFLSGAAGLLYEVVWSKQLSYLLGNSLHSVATVVAAFLGGLALGARLLGVPLARRRDGARVYAALELGVAVLGRGDAADAARARPAGRRAVPRRSAARARRSRWRGSACCSRCCCRRRR